MENVVSSIPLYEQTIPWEANYDERRVPAVEIPDPLRMADGSVITTADEWMEKRRPELIHAFQNIMYGKPLPPATSFTSRVLSEKLLGNYGKRQEIEMTFTGPTGRTLQTIMLLYTPLTVQKVPVFVGLTFHGNHAVETDPAIIPTGRKEVARGFVARRYPVETILKRGYAIAAAAYHDFYLDKPGPDGWENSVYPLYYDSVVPRPPHASAINAWAWGISRMLDVLTESCPQIDSGKAIVYGHSRLGKTSLWTGVIDERFKLTCVNNSGCGGAALDRRLFGETLFSMMGCCNDYTFWFSDQLQPYARTPEKLPFDQHELIACIAPRSVAVHSAILDTWSDPKGEYISTYHAGKVFRLFGLSVPEDPEQPIVGTPVGGELSYYIRNGGHDILEEDFLHYMDCADRIFKMY